MSAIKNILFDLDGTLTDPKDGIVNSILHSLSKLNITEEKQHELLSFIGPPLRNSFIERYKLSDALGDDALKHYREYFSDKGWEENTPYAEIHNVLADLKAKGFNLFVATSKPTVFAERILKHFKLHHFFNDVTGSNLDNTMNEKAEVIAHILEKHNLHSDDCIMVGDRKYDIIGAKENNMRSIAVTYGYGSEQEFLEYGADFIISNCIEINSLIETINSK